MIGDTECGAPLCIDKSLVNRSIYDKDKEEYAVGILKPNFDALLRKRINYTRICVPIGKAPEC